MDALVTLSLTEYQYYPAFLFLCFGSVLNSLEGSQFRKDHVVHVVCCICKWLPHVLLFNSLQSVVGYALCSDECMQRMRCTRQLLNFVSQKVNSPCFEGHLNREAKVPCSMERWVIFMWLLCNTIELISSWKGICFYNESCNRYMYNCIPN